MSKADTIARRIVASIYSWYTIEDGRAYAFLDSHSLPCYYVEKNAKNLYRVIKFDKTKFSSQHGRGVFNSILVALKVGSGEALKEFQDCIRYDRTITAGKAVAPLLRELGMTVPEFENLFHTGTDFTSGGDLVEKSHRNWRLVFEKGTRSPVQVMALLDRVDELLGGFSDALSYGIVEIKEDLPPRVLADYNPKNDSLRIKSNCDSTMLHEVLHELAHRLWFMIMSREQRRMVESRYEKMLHEGGGLLWAGEDVFPSEYSKTGVEEFFAECFAFWRAGELCGSLSKFMESLFMKKRNGIRRFN